mmetsp:Transcript_21562/g.30188  ORF Transcript_21562/g.30188 Transcript_21562/m.30188 type:complete len:287 (+) Transcript_21562:149-1009(+)|eukprot:jgi/Bigna1/79024/fgenesh1_pg.59_\
MLSPNGDGKKKNGLDGACNAGQLVAQMALASIYILPLVTFTIIYPIAIASGRVWPGDFFISSALDTGLAHCIGAIGLNLAVEAMMLCAMIRFLIVRIWIRKTESSASMHPRSSFLISNSLSWAQNLNSTALGLAFTCNVCLFGATAFNVGDPRIDNDNGYFGIHIPFAFIGFLSASVYVILQTVIDEILLEAAKGDDEKEKSRSWVHTLRWALSIGSFICFIGMFACLGYSMPISATFEILLISLALVYFSTWHWEFAEFAKSINGIFSRVLGALDHHDYALLHSE